MAEETVRVRIDLGYDGTDFRGWAVQPRLRTVQGELEAALARVIGAPVRTVVAGRTDAGVHARRQVVHTDLPVTALPRLRGRGQRPLGDALVSRLTGALSFAGAEDIVILAAAEVPAHFDARFAAIWRRYAYRIADPRAQRDPLTRTSTVVHRRELDAEAMGAAVREVLGLHDFLPFCKPRPESTTIRTLLDASVVRGDGGTIEIGLRADAFCHHMVRALVGGLVRVGEGAWPVDRPAVLIARAEAGASDAELGPMHVMPAHGLVLEEIGYPDEGEWAAQAERARARRAPIAEG